MMDKKSWLQINVSCFLRKIAENIYMPQFAIVYEISIK